MYVGGSNPQIWATFVFKNQPEVAITQHAKIRPIWSPWLSIRVGRQLCICQRTDLFQCHVKEVCNVFPVCAGSAEMVTKQSKLIRGHLNRLRLSQKIGI
jgi:hypothetical protein